MPNIPLTTTNLSYIPKELFLVGGVSREGSADWGALDDTFVAVRVPENKKHLIAANNIWTKNRTWKAYTSSSSYDIAFNSENNIVYLCLHNNPDFRTDAQNTTSGVSTEIPSHTFGRQTYPDGYTWLPLWKVDFTEYEFTNTTDLPIPALDLTPDYNTFTEKYEPLCGTGVTSFGCCCLYFKDNSVDEITGEVYSAGDVTNEVIFSDCFECQKLADALDRDVLFLSGVTTGGINSSHPGENPLCPATKTIKGLKEKLQDQIYDLIPGSSKDYQLQLLNNHNHKGIMTATIDLAGLTDEEKTISTRAQTVFVVVNDPTGTGANLRLKTIPVGIDKQLVYGIEIVSEGSGYGDIPSYVLSSVPRTVNGTDIDNDDAVPAEILQRITIRPYPTDIYTNPKLFTPPVKYRVLASTTNADLYQAVPTSASIERIAIMADPKFYATQAPAVFTKNNASIIQMTTEVVLYEPGTEIVEGGGGQEMLLGPGQVENEYVDANNSATNTSTGYEVNIISATSDGSGYVELDDTTKATGYRLVVNDDPASFTPGQSASYNGNTNLKVWSVTPPLLDSRTGSFFDITDISPIGITSPTNQITVKSYQFDIQINLV